MTLRYRISRSVIKETFDHLRRCGNGLRECQVAWLSSWRAHETITDVVHTKHTATAGGFRVDDTWLTTLWQRLADSETGARVQVHTHPGHAFHSHIDDRWPLIHTAGFLSLVIPNFAMGAVGFEGAHLVELAAAGRWQPVPIAERLQVVL